MNQLIPQNTLEGVPDELLEMIIKRAVKIEEPISLTEVLFDGQRLIRIAWHQVHQLLRPFRKSPKMRAIAKGVLHKVNTFSIDLAQVFVGVHYHPELEPDNQDQCDGLCDSWIDVDDWEVTAVNRRDLLHALVLTHDNRPLAYLKSFRHLEIKVELVGYSFCTARPARIPLRQRRVLGYILKNFPVLRSLKLSVHDTGTISRNAVYRLGGINGPIVRDARKRSQLHATETEQKIFGLFMWMLKSRSFPNMKNKDMELTHNTESSACVETVWNPSERTAGQVLPLIWEMMDSPRALVNFS